jgi:hypothetical protein
MKVQTVKTELIKNTTYKVVIPFYVYAALSFFVATILLFCSYHSFTQHYFQPRTLAITHTMALGWGTMIILGASHQLVPVLIEARLHSTLLAYLSFAMAAVGIPILVISFFTFHFGWFAVTGALLINGAVLFFLINMVLSIWKSPNKNVYALFVLTATFWLMITTLIGLLLVCNFSHPVLPAASIHYLSLHAHIGIIGWFLLLVMGVGSRLIPMFLISKFHNDRYLWSIYGLTNGALLAFIILFILQSVSMWYMVPVSSLLIALILFGRFCYLAFKQRIRKNVDEQMKISLLSITMMALPMIFLAVLIGFVLRSGNQGSKEILAYGFSIFFGWITAIIFGMTFKTLPFIVWNKIYHDKGGIGKTPNPKDLFSSPVFNTMALTFLGGFILFMAGILIVNSMLLQVAAVLLVIASALYNWNVMKMLLHKPLIR